MRNKNLFFGLFYLFLVILIIILSFQFEVYSDLQLKNIHSFKEKIILLKEKHSHWLTLVFFFSSLVWVLFMGFTFPFLIISGILFNNIFGTFLCLTAFTIGATLNFIIAKHFFKEKVQNYFKKKYPNLRKNIKKNNFKYFLIMRIFPGVPFPIKNLSGVIFDLNKKSFFFATFFGELPQIYLFLTIFQELLNSLNDFGKIKFSVIYNFEIIVAILTYLLVFLVADHFRKKF